MKKVYLAGYIDYDNEKYTFIYENNLLTLISVNNNYNIFYEYKYIDEFNGKTIDGFNIIFNINKNIYCKSGYYKCSPRFILISRNQGEDISKLNFSSLTFSGGIINRFYTNKKMIEMDLHQENFYKVKDVKETVLAEKVNLNGQKTEFEFSIMKPGLKNDGMITFGDYNSLFRIKYENKKNYKMIIKDLNSIDLFFKFCANRINISFNEVYLEIKNAKNLYEKKVEIIIPYMNEYFENKNILDFDIFKNHFSKIFEFLDKCNYIFSIIPEDNISFEKISNKDYCACFSCFESIYQYIYGKKNKSKKETDKLKLKEKTEEYELEEIKKEILPFLSELDKKYDGKNIFLSRFIKIISTANLKLETCIYNEIKKYPFLKETLFYERRKIIIDKGILPSVIKAVGDRDDITHNNTIKLDDISIGIYEIISKLNYIMILNYIGVSKDIYCDKIVMLSLKKII